MTTTICILIVQPKMSGPLMPGTNDVIDMHDDGNYMRPLKVKGHAILFCVWRMAAKELLSSNLNNVQTLTSPQMTLPFHTQPLILQKSLLLFRALSLDPTRWLAE